MAVAGLKPRALPTIQMQATGVGGSTKFLKSAELPVALGGAPGTLTVHVIENDIPLLLPVDFCSKLGMILDLPALVIHWTSIQSKSSITRLAGGGHLAIDLFEFPSDGWRCPYDNPSTVRAGASSYNPAPRSAFEISQPSARLQRGQRPPLAHHVGAASMPLDEPRSSSVKKLKLFRAKGLGGEGYQLLRGCTGGAR